MNKEDQIESFVQSHRGSFDDVQPPATVWQRIERSLDRSDRNHIPAFIARQSWKIAAVLVLMLALTYRFIPLNAGTQGDPAELTDMENFYDHALAVKVSRMEPGQGVTADMLLAQQQKDPAFIQLKLAFRENPGNARVHAALYQYYQARLVLVDQVNESMHQVTEENETH
jgi:hypothetical protein